jgi:cation diffusion facilitator CzcD-associated flavoprotein CzcO
MRIYGDSAMTKGAWLGSITPPEPNPPPFGALVSSPLPSLTLHAQITPAGVEHVDVLIVGAGLAGIGAACHLLRKHPQRTIALLEARDAIGGTWDLFRYPGVRSDTSMYTFGYPFSPWTGTKSIADGVSILDYIRRTAAEFGADQKIRYGHRVVQAEWSSAEATWTVTAEQADSGKTRTLTCSFLYLCTGYYRYDQGYTPNFRRVEAFRGEVVHPQHWPQDLDYDGKRVVVIGSGPTATTLVPALAQRAAKVTMLQRSPAYVVSLPSRDALVERLERLLPGRAAHAVARWKYIYTTLAFHRLSRRAPKLARRLITRRVERQLPAGYDVGLHFNPRYNPWDERPCLVPSESRLPTPHSPHVHRQ